MFKVCAGVSRKTENPLFIIEMKRLCKDVDITDRGLISRAVYACLNKKYKRNDVVKYFSQVSGLTENQIRYIYHRYGKRVLYPITEIIISDLQEGLREGNIAFPPIWYREKIDGSSGKVRRIGIQNIKHQLYDYIAVEALSPIFRRIGEFQYASIKGRGTTKGKEKISRWLKNGKVRYFAKLDIRKCFESIDTGVLMEFLRKHIKNDPALMLIERLLGSFERGLSIGSYLSQYLCNLFMSILYHHIKEDLFKTRRGKRKNLVKNCLIYMDDIYVDSGSKKDLEKSIKMIIRKAAEINLEIKQNFLIKRTDENFVDMLGFKIYRTHTEIRKRIFLRIRRNFRKARKDINIRVAKKCLSYFGYLKHTNSQKIQRKLKIKETLKLCKGVIKNEGKIFEAAAAG